MPFRSALAVCLLLVAACGSSSTPKPTTTSNVPAFLQVLNNLPKDGTVDKNSALEAFALTIGPLPGVSVPSGPPMTTSIDGSGPVRWLFGHFSELTQAQQTAVMGYIKPLPTTHMVLTAYRVGSANTRAPRAQDYNLVQSIIDTAETSIAEKIGRKLGIPISFDLSATPAADPTVDGSTWLYDTHLKEVGTPGSCDMLLYPRSWAGPSEELTETLYHEVFHCFQGSLQPVKYYYDTTSAPDWLFEGSANWAGDTLAGSATGDSGWWKKYLEDPTTPLFQRTYDAMGFFAQMNVSGINPWTTLDTMILAAAPDKGSAPAYAAGLGSQQDLFETTWGSSFLRNSALGAGWDTTGPGITTAKFEPSTTVVSNGSNRPADVAGYTNYIMGLNVTADVVTINTGSHSRLHSDTPTGYAADNPAGTYCAASGGCNCPSGSARSGLPALPAIPAGTYYLSDNGGSGGDQMSVSGQSLDDYCNTAVVESCLVGTWHETSPFPDFGSGLIKSNGPFGRILTFTKDGHVTEDVGPTPTLTITGGVTLKLSGTATARVIADHGRATFTNEDDTHLAATETDGGISVTVTFSQIFSGMNLGPGFTTYECSPHTLTVHEPPVTLTFAH